MSELKVTRAGLVSTLTISNPAKLNAMSDAMWLSFEAALSEMDRDPQSRVLVVRGEGEKAFVAGADTSQFGDLRNTPEGSAKYNAGVRAAVAAPGRCRKLVLADIRGYCIGGGLALALACDIRIGADNARFRMPAAAIGLGYPPESLRRFVETIGASTTLDIFASARKFGAAEALRMGLLNQLHPLDTMDRVVDDYASMIADNAPLTIAAVKFAVSQFGREPADRDWATAEQMVKACFASADHKEGTRAIAERRVPKFTGS